MTAEQGGRRRVRWNWRVAGIVSVLFVVIAGAVVATDVLSVRDRHANVAAASRP